jgi:DNA-binding MarR family transcriptional regulator/GNAT superfamily N-acetyltransferase
MSAATNPPRPREPGRPEIDAVRRFNRLYTRRIGVLNSHFLDSPFSLTEVRVLYELSRRAPMMAAELADELGLDRGYLSRLLARLDERGIVEKQRSAEDGRARLLQMTAKGRRIFATLESRQDEAVGTLLEPMAPDSRAHLLASMAKISSLLGEPVDSPGTFLLRPPGPGDLGWIVHRQAVLYDQEYGWNQEFEALLARIVADFVDHIDPDRERAWVAERDHQVVGSIFCVMKSATVAKLRLLYVEPECRGLGIGGRLVEECIRFARSARYKRLTLWTNDVLRAARRIYERAGFALVAEEPHHSYGKDLVAQTWELTL